MILSEVDLINVARTRLGNASQSTVSQQVVSIQLDIDTKNYLGTNKKFANVVFNVVDVNGVDTWAYEGYALSDTRSVPVLLNLPTLAILYDEWRSQGNNGAFIDFLNSLQGNQGFTGWTPILSQVPLTGGKVVVRLTSFVGGEGTLPSELQDKIGKYQKADGTFTSDVNEAQDIAAELKAIVEQNSEAVEGLAAEADADRVAAQAANEEAQTAKTAAQTAATTATAKATEATTKAAEALNSASNAATANTNAQTAATTATTKATEATTKAAEALNSANQSAASAAASSAVALGVSTGRNSIAPSILLDFANTQQLDSRLTFTRASTATYFDRSGFLRIAPANVARFGFDPNTGESLGLLIEESRTNLFLQSNSLSAFSNGSQSTSTFNNIISPDGSQNATLLTISTSGGDSGLRVATNMGNAKTYCTSIFAKAGTSNWIYIRNIATGVSGDGVWFNLATGVLGTKQAGISSAGIQNCGNGWFRCWIIASTPASIVNNLIDIKVSNADNTHSSTNGQTVYLYGGQLEEGTIPTSYIPTTNATVTRSSDLCAFSAQLNSQIKNTGTWVGEVSKTTFNNISPRIIGSSTAYTAITVYPLPRGEYFDGAGNYTAINSGTVNSKKVSIAMSYKSGQAGICIDNSDVATAGYVHPVSLSIFIGCGNGGGGNFLNGFVRKVAYYAAQLSNTELKELTTIKLAGANPNQLPTAGDLGEAAFMQLRSLLRMKARSEVNYHGTGAQVGYTIRRPYAFTLAVVNSNGSTTTSLPTANADGSYTADTNYTLWHNAPVGTALTLEIIPILY